MIGGSYDAPSSVSPKPKPQKKSQRLEKQAAKLGFTLSPLTT